MKPDPKLLTFDEATHQYMYGGFGVPGVSEVLDALGIKPKIPDMPVVRARFERKAKIGKAVAFAATLLVDGGLDEESVHPEVAPYLEGLSSFLEKVAVKHCEYPVYAPSMGMAGTLDAAGTSLDFDLNGVWDYKISKPARWHRIQACLYDMMLEEFKTGDKIRLEEAELWHVPAVVYILKKPNKSGQLFEVVKATQEDMVVAWSLPRIYAYRKAEGLL